MQRTEPSPEGSVTVSDVLVPGTSTTPDYDAVAMPQPIPNHPLAGAAGSFADDPFWDEFVQLMEDERRKIDERYPVED